MAIQEFREKYEAACAEVETAEAYVNRLEAKRDKLSIGLSSLDAEIDTANAEAEKKMQCFVADNIEEAELTEARSAVANLKRKHRDNKSLVDALTVKIEKAKNASKSAQDARNRAKGNLVFQVAMDEKARAFSVGEKALKRAYLATQRSQAAGYAPTLKEFVGEVFKMLHISEEERDSLFSSLEKEYGFPMK